MKKVTVLSFLAIYLLLNFGISMKIHYCGDSISFVDFFALSTKTCCGGKKPPCCKDEIAYVNPSIIQDNSGVLNYSFPDYAKYNLVNYDFSFLSIYESKRVKQYENCLPIEFIHQKVPLYLYNNVFRI